MRKEIQHPDRAVSTAAYSAAIEIDGWVYVSGQGPIDQKTGTVLRGTIAEETKATLDNVRKVLQNAGCDLDDVVKSTVHISDITLFDEFNRAYAEYFVGVVPLPARTTVQSALWNGIQVEIDVVARKG